ncbi:MAG: type II toxin-antitoxin system RelE/ParE family toxin [Desulfobacteraceae bacterium]
MAQAEDPSTFGKALKGVLREFWRYRVGSYRVIYKIEDARLLVLVVRAAHRSDVYR